MVKQAIDKQNQNLIYQIEKLEKIIGILEKYEPFENNWTQKETQKDRAEYYKTYEAVLKLKQQLKKIKGEK